MIFSHFPESQDSESLRNHSNTAVSSSFKIPGLIQDSDQVKTETLDLFSLLPNCSH